MKTRQAILILAGVFLASLTNAQIINQFKKEETFCSYLQFPTQKERKSKMTIEIIEENLLGNVANKVIKNEAIAGALTGKGGVLGDQTEEVIELDLIPGVFVTDGDLLAEVSYSGEFMSKKTMNIPIEMYGKYDVSKGAMNDIMALVSFKVYTMPDKKQIYASDKVWVKGQKSSTGTTSTTQSGMSVTTTSGADMEADVKRMVTGWSKKKLDMMYGMGVRNRSLTAYLLKKYDDKELKKKAQETQENLLACINTMRKDRTGEEYNAKVDACLAHYKNMLKQYKPGVKKQKEAQVTDNNVWCLYYNIAVANFLKGNSKEAKSYISKAYEMRKPNVKDITNKKGEKVGSFQGPTFNAGFDDIQATKEIINNYFNGISTTPKNFVAFLNSEEDMRAASKIAREYAANMMVSALVGFEAPVDFVRSDIKEGVKSFNGTATEGDKTVDYTVKKTWHSFIPLNANKYVLNAQSADKTTNVKLGYYKSLSPRSTLYRNSYALRTGEKSYYTLPSGAYYDNSKVNDKTKYFVGKSNAKGNKKPFSGVKFQYDYNGDIIVTGKAIRDKGLWYGWVLTNDSEYLGAIEFTGRIKNNNYKEATAINFEKTVIERERNMKFFEAFTQKSLTGTIDAEEISKNTSSKKVDVTKKVVSKDDKGNAVNEKISKSELSRTYVY